MKNIILLMSIFLSLVNGLASEPFRQVLSSASRSVSVDHWELTNEDLRLQTEEQWSVRKVVPFNSHAAEGVQQFGAYLAPTPGFIEQVYCMYPWADEMNRTIFLLHNSAADKGVSVEFSLDELPYFTLWKNTTALEEGYVTGLEPGTGFPFNRSVERRFGRVPKLKPGQSRTFTLEYGVHSTATDVQRVVGRISRIQGKRTPEIESEPAELN